MSKRIGIIVGSLREKSFNRMIANTIPELVDSAEYEYISIIFTERTPSSSEARS